MTMSVVILRVLGWKPGDKVQLGLDDHQMIVKKAKG
jgi:bifunctional DNA-binding transcriptional regulator/antitoxin component of YhaV-PrlF toxin-antitoxin module